MTYRRITVLEINEAEEFKLDDFIWALRQLLLVSEDGFFKFKDRTFHLAEINEQLKELEHYEYNADV